jgi:hypothetical protein
MGKSSWLGAEMRFMVDGDPAGCRLKPIKISPQRSGLARLLHIPAYQVEAGPIIGGECIFPRFGACTAESSSPPFEILSSRLCNNPPNRQLGPSFIMATKMMPFRSSKWAIRSLSTSRPAHVRQFSSCPSTLTISPHRRTTPITTTETSKRTQATAAAPAQ